MPVPRKISFEFTTDLDIDGGRRFGWLVSLPQLEHLSFFVAEEPA